MTTAKTTDLNRSRQQLRPRFTGAVTVFAFTAVLVACSGDESSLVTTVPPIVSTTEVVPTALDGTTEDQEQPTPFPSVPAAQYLEDALHRRSSGYKFATVISVAGQEATTVSGSVVGEASHMVVSSGGADLEYISMPQGRWVKGEDGVWSALESEPSGGMPLAGLEGPTTAEYVRADGNVVVVSASYPGTALGVPDLDEVTVEFEIADGLLVLMRYESSVGESIIVSTTEMVDVDPTVAITAPPTEG